MKIERLLSIIILLLDKQIVSANTLAKTFDVSKRTIYRDIETLEFAGIPIISYPGVNGGFGLIDTFKMNSFTFTDYEKQKILDALQLQEQLLPFQKVTSIINGKLQATNTTTTKANLTLSSATLHNPLVEKQTNIKLKQLYQALSNHQKVKISYITSNGDFSNRTILPLELTLQNGSWYLSSFCELRKDIRLFKITRIRKIELLDITFDKKLPPTIPDNTLEVEIQLSFTKKSLGKLYDFFLDEQLTITKDKVLVSFLYNTNNNLIPFLLMFGNQVTVIQPASLKQKHISCIQEMQKIY